MSGGPGSAGGFAAIVTTRDRPALLADALASLAAQSQPPVEVLIANDGRLPLELPVASLGPWPTRTLQLEVRNPGAARNRAAAEARAPWLAFLDDDDLWRPNHLASLAQAFTRPEVELAYSDCAVVREDVVEGRRVERDRIVIARDWDEAVMRENDYVPPSAMAIRRASFERLGGFDESFTRSEDWDLLLRAAARVRPVRVPGVTVEVRLRPSGNASTEAGAERRACLDRLAARHGLPPLSIKTFWEVAEALASMDAPR